MLDKSLLTKVSAKTRKPLQYVREQVSKRATRIGVTSPVALILWARDLRISTTLYLRKLDPQIQEQVRSAQLSPPKSERRAGRDRANQPFKAHKVADPVIHAIEDLLADDELRSRCKDLLTRPRHFDRALREATTVLENRIRTTSGLKNRLNPEALVNTVLNADPNKAILVISTEPNEQAGFHSICRGIVLAFRHKAHHQLDDRVSRNDAVKFCSFVDVLLSMLASASKRVTSGVAP